MIINQFTLIEQIVTTLSSFKISNIVISPGSRNAPIVEAFSAHKGFNLYTIVDERSAGFFALGLSLKSKEATVLVCTSGSAVLNYAPAISEAYYQGIPLIVLSADRPSDFVNQMAGQTIKQQNALGDFVKGFYQFPDNCSTESQFRYSYRMINEGLIKAYDKLNGPIHFNLPLNEPLYGHEWSFENTIKKTIKNLSSNVLDHFDELKDIWKSSKKILFLVGCLDYDQKLDETLARLKQDSRVIILHESTSNLIESNDFPCIDPVIIPAEKDINNFSPDLLITIGRNVVSKKVKAFLQKSKINSYWSFDQQENLVDTYYCLSHQVNVSPNVILKELNVIETGSDYREKWIDLRDRTNDIRQNYLSELEFCDFKVFEEIYKAIPEESVVHYGNSSVVRYSNLFNNSNKRLQCFSNRGTSGIDGSLSTAVGYSFLSEKTNTLIIGDISFLYDSNGLWNKYMGNNLKIILINNGGGGIFEIIDGAKDSPVNKEHLKYEHSTNVKGICENFGLAYYYNEFGTNLSSILHELYSKNHSALLEINTASIQNANYLRSFFKELSK